MTVLKPRALRPGARIAVVSPASTPKAELVQAGVDHLKRLGYEPVVARHALDRGPLYYAGRKSERLADLHEAFADTAIDGILCTRGGWGSAELLPELDVELVRRHPKPFIGYSDHTSLHVWLARATGLVTFYGPMCAADFSREDGPDLASWRQALEGETTWKIDAGAGLRVLREGVAEGRLTGGCLSILTESLGTAYAPLPPGGQTILFLEDIGTKAYQWDRMLLHLRYAGQMEGVTGIVFGDMAQCCAPEERSYLEEALLHNLSEFAGPIAIGLRSGHVGAGNLTLPLGIRARMEAVGVEPQLEFLEPAVTV